MPILTKLLGAEHRATFRNPVADWLSDALTGGSQTLSGERVSPDSAMGLSAYYGAIRCISEDCGKLPLKLFRKINAQDKEELPNTWLYQLLHNVPNPEMSSQSLRETLTSHALGWGNGFAEIVRGPGGMALAMYPLNPTRVRITRDKDTRAILYMVTDDKRTEQPVPAANMFHLHGLGFDGITGYSMAKIAKQSLGIAKAQENSAAALFGNLGRPGTAIKLANTLTDEAKRKLSRQFQSAHAGGSGNWYRTVVLEQGTELASLPPINPRDAEWILERQFSVEEICRWARMPPHKLQHLLRSTFSNITEQNIEYVVDTLMPWLKRWEAEIWRKLIPAADQATVLAEHTVAGLLQGNPEQQSKLFSAGRNGGWFSVNDIRSLLNMNSIGAKGDIYLEPQNMGPAGAPGPAGEDGKPGTDGNDGTDGDDGKRGGIGLDGREGERGETGSQGEPGSLLLLDVEKFRDVHLPTMTSAFGRVLRIEADRAERAEKRHGLLEWTEEFYASHGEQVRGVLIGPIEAFCGSLWLAGAAEPMPEAVSQLVASCTAEIVERHVAESQAALAAGPIAEVLASWRNGRAEATAGAELRVLVDLLLPLLGKP
jgi:HK97 family phage portal protein